jgi:single-strand DNA-binding protein
VKFPVATSETYTNKEGQKVSNTDWHSVVINAKGLVDVAHKYLKKGHKVYLEGRIKTRKWQDQTGADRYTTEIQANQMTMLTSRADGEANSGYGNENQVQSPVSTPMPSVSNNSGKQEEDDLPF